MKHMETEGAWHATVRKIVRGIPIALVAVGSMILLFADLQSTYPAMVVEVGDRFYLSREKYPTGKTVDILYDVGDPTRFHPEGDTMFLRHGGAVSTGVIWLLASAVFVHVVTTAFYGGRIDFRPLWQSVADISHRR